MAMFGMHKIRAATLAGLVLLALAPAARAAGEVTRTCALAEFGSPRYGCDFAHFAYADPGAPKGGTITLGTVGSFDTLNWLPLQGDYPRSIGLLYDTLMVEPQDELAVFYPLIAEAVEYPADRSWIVFHLNPQARWHDGTPITAEDVAWTFRMIREHARPFLRSFYEDVAGVEVLDARRVKFTMATRDSMKPLVRLAGMTVLPRHWWTAEGRDVTRGTLEPPLGSGPYRLAQVTPGRTLVYQRVPDYWAQDLPARAGQFNFDRVKYDYYLDRQVAFEAFKSGAADFRQEFTSLHWATGYDIPQVRDGRIVKREVRTEDPRGLQGFMMNTRRPPFDDIRVRQALVYLFDFEWTNQNLFYDLYERMTSYFNATGYRATGVPEGLERDILEAHRGKILDAVFTEPFRLPVTDGSGNIRRQLRAAWELLREAGWEVRDGALVHTATGQPMSFELLYTEPSFERVILPYVRNLERAGIRARPRLVDAAQWVRRYQEFDFDMISFAFTFFPPPGSELRSFFGSAAAEVPGSGNLMGIRDPVVDALIETVVSAPDLETKQAATRALDRVLLWGHYAVPHWLKEAAWIAYWNRFGHPQTEPVYDFGFANTIAFQPTWWIDPAKDAGLNKER